MLNINKLESQNMNIPLAVEALRNSGYGWISKWDLGNMLRIAIEASENGAKPSVKEEKEGEID